ncbi:MAG: peptidyl-tRNA hydrolase Pth2 [Candidatus Marsarchaeota archaeon]|nr:peptidyl-tRNA hydrolase Pth2 [Candidatus Marsarchaeota archaeon]
MEDEIKQAIIIRSDLEMSRGKIAAQAAHASLMSYFEAERSDPKKAKLWLDSGEKKIVLKVSDEQSLIKLYNAFKFRQIPCALVTDAGLTEIPPGSKTALGVGPWDSKGVNEFTLGLKLL